MSKLTKKTATRLATLINSMECSEIMCKAMKRDGNYDRADYYRNEYYAVLIVLADEFGINLPNLGLARELHDDEMYPLRYLAA